jgi:hypothetical protein
MKLLMVIVCFAAVGLTACKKEAPGLKPLPGRRMAEIEAIGATHRVVPPLTGYQYRASFKDGVWEVSCKTNKTQVDWLVIARIQDADGKVEQVTPP